MQEIIDIKDKNVTMPEDRFTIDKIIKETGLKKDFINKCLTDLKVFVEPYATRGPYNCWLFDSNAVVLFREIRKLKEQGLTISEIKKRLEPIANTYQNGYQDSPKEQGKVYKTTNESDKTYGGEFVGFLKSQLEKRERERDELLKSLQIKEKELRDLQFQYNAQESSIKLLPEGKTPEQIKEEWELEQKRKLEVAKIMGELKTIGTLRFLKKKKLIKKLESLLES